MNNEFEKRIDSLSLDEEDKKVIRNLIITLFTKYHLQFYNPTEPPLVKKGGL